MLIKYCTIMSYLLIKFIEMFMRDPIQHFPICIWLLGTFTSKNILELFWVLVQLVINFY